MLFRSGLREHLLLVHFIALVLEDEHMQKAAPEKAADRIQRQEGVGELKRDRPRHRDAEGEYHFVAPLDRPARAQQFSERQTRTEDVDRDQPCIHQVTQRTGHIRAVGADGEENVGETVRGERDDEKRQQDVSGPQQTLAQLAGHLQINRDVTCPSAGGEHHRQEEEGGVGEEKTRKLQPGEYAPQDVRHEKNRQTHEKTAAFARSQPRLFFAPAGQLPPVDDQMDAQCDGGDGRIKAVVQHEKTSLYR